MKNWYLTRDEIAGSQHRGVELLPNKYVKLTEKQAQIHNKNKEEPSVTEAGSPPESIAQCQFADEYETDVPEPKQERRERRKKDAKGES